MRRFEAAVQEARAYFGIDPAWRTPVQAKASDGAYVTAHPGYLDAPICIELDFFQRHPEKIREYAAHEVAHILSAELNRLRSVMPEEFQNKDAPAGRMFDDALEALTVRLERLFLRERPEPGADTPAPVYFSSA